MLLYILKSVIVLRRYDSIIQTVENETIELENKTLFFFAQAMRELNGKELGGSHIEVSLAKPPSDKKKKEEMLRARERRMMQMMQMMQTRGAYDNAL